MATTATPASSAQAGTAQSSKQQWLDAYEREHAITMKVLREFPTDKADFQPHPDCRTARELAWIFVLERGLGQIVLNDGFAKGAPGESPKPPQSFDAVIAAYENAHKEFGDMVRAMPDEQLFETVKFFTGPKMLSDVQRINFLWFLLSDEIHHRGQFSVYSRMAGARVPSIYGPSKDEPWF
ncbi:MAG TPA: DinB family protein [Gemmatimonadaceae bacterium]|nr:DinB family protein [Gemmatimonadaceae bacterium]